MPGVWKKTLNYLGLVEEDEFEGFERAPERAPEPEIRRFQRPTAVRMPAEEPDLMVRVVETPRAASAIHKAEPKRFNEAREIGDRYKEGIAVIMSLQGADDAVARRLVDFASGLVYAQNGKLELVADRVYLLTPANVEVSAEERERFTGGAFYNQL
jgi:cell division inhibitor SepF